MTKEQHELLIEVLRECNDFRIAYIEYLKSKDKAFTDFYRKYESELVDYQLMPSTRSVDDKLIQIFDERNYKYLTTQRFLLEEVLALIKGNYVSPEFKITSVLVKGEYQLDKFVLLPIFGWVDPGFRIRKLKDVHFVVSTSGIQVVSKAYCYPMAPEMLKKLDEKYYDIQSEKEFRKAGFE